MGMEMVAIAQEHWLLNRIATEDKARRNIVRQIFLAIVLLLALFTVVVVSNMDIVKANAATGRMIDAQYWDAEVANFDATLFVTVDGNVWRTENPVTNEFGEVLSYGTPVRIMFDGMFTDDVGDNQILSIEAR